MTRNGGDHSRRRRRRRSYAQIVAVTRAPSRLHLDIEPKNCRFQGLAAAAAAQKYERAAGRRHRVGVCGRVDGARGAAV